MGTGEADDVVSGRSHDRQRAVLMSASGQLYGRLRDLPRDGRKVGSGGESPRVVGFEVHRRGCVKVTDEADMLDPPTRAG